MGGERSPDGTGRPGRGTGRALVPVLLAAVLALPAPPAQAAPSGREAVRSGADSGGTAADAGGSGAARPAPAGPPSTAPARHTVTLLTGDRVTASADGAQVTVTPGAGRAGIRFTTLRAGGRQLVLPEDARPLVTAGLLDRRLFDVTELVRAGYDDARSPGLPLLVTRRGADPAAGLTGPGLRTTARLPHAGAVTVTKSAAPAAWAAIRSQRAHLARIRLHTPAAPAPGPGSTATSGGASGQGSDATSGGASGPASTSASGGAGPAAETHTLTVRHLGPDGRASSVAETMVLDLTGDVRAVLSDAAGTSSAELPRGTYVLVADVVDFGDTDSTWHRLVQPELVLDRDATVTVDARRSAPVRTSVPRPDARTALVDLGFDRRDGDRPGFTLSLAADGFDGLYAGQIGGDVDATRMTGYLASTWGVPGPRGDFADTPYTYGLLDTRPGGFFTGLDRTVAEGDLAAVDTRLVAQVPGRPATKAHFATAPGVTGTLAALLPFRLPARTVHLLDAGDTQWSGAFGENVPGPGGLPTEVTALGQGYRSYRAGHRYTDRWNAAVFGPMFDFAGHAGRRGDTVWFGVPMYSDQDSHRGGSLTDTASTLLYRDGVLLARSGAGNLETEVPPGPGTFRVEKRTTRPSFSDLSTRVDSVWTFRSDTAGEAGESFPLWAVRYAPPVDDHNRVRPGPVTVLPVTVMSQPQARVGAVRELAVEVSGDAGRTWRPARVVPAGGAGYRAVVATPPGAASLSVRAVLVDTDGNRLEQTIVDAYRYASRERDR
ncbi:peptidase S8 [Micromonospora sp. WMMC415]|uniref:peptidase S8 n=1 Tax=Micromonospora sp. WMMC415 TaxID=2675222 RepID=UPI0012B46420|nr:peptidase S8 [Micromonospora sp. WMMC415]QGN48332.1 peptidase S8 [Micromonospora sp. WMMC415]